MLMDIYGDFPHTKGAYLITKEIDPDSLDYDLHEQALGCALMCSPLTERFWVHIPGDMSRDFKGFLTDGTWRTEGGVLEMSEVMALHSAIRYAHYMRLFSNSYSYEP